MGFFNRKKKNEEGQQVPETSVAEKPKKAEAKKAEEPKKAAVAAARETGHAYRVLVRAIVTEKSARLGEANQYAFEVARDANKLEIRKAVQAVYGVMPQAVRVMVIAGKPVRTRAGKSRRSGWRKAIVTLKKGDRIDLYANA